VTSKRSDLVAERALDLALQILGFALAFLRFAFGAKTLIVGRLADSLLGVASSFVCEPLAFSVSSPMMYLLISAKRPCASWLINAEILAMVAKFATNRLSYNDILPGTSSPVGR
jgi:hypothetical protein